MDSTPVQGREEGGKEQQYRREISRRSPPRNHHDEFMIRVYEGLLDGLIELQRFEGAIEQRIREVSE